MCRTSILWRLTLDVVRPTPIPSGPTWVEVHGPGSRVLSRSVERAGPLGLGARPEQAQVRPSPLTVFPLLVGAGAPLPQAKGLAGSRILPGARGSEADTLCRACRAASLVTFPQTPSFASRWPAAHFYVALGSNFLCRYAAHTSPVSCFTLFLSESDSLSLELADHTRRLVVGAGVPGFCRL